MGTHLALRGALAATCASLLLGTSLGGAGQRASADEPALQVLFDGSVGEEHLPKGQGVTVVFTPSAGRPAALLGVGAGTAWARSWLRGLPKDISGFQHLDLDLRTVAGEARGLQLHLADAEDRVATVTLEPVTLEWTTRRVDLGDFNPEPGFDPTSIASLTFLWYRPVAVTVALSKATLVPGPDGWRHPPEEQMRRIFGAQRARSVKHEATAHFEIWSDSPSALKPLGASLEEEAERIVFLLGAEKDALAGMKLPVYAFKQASDFQDYCERVLGTTKEAARRTQATGTSWMLVMQHQSGPSPERRRRLALTLAAHVYGPYGGAWLQTGLAELCVRGLDDRPISKEMAPRVKNGDHWPLAKLFGAARLTAPADPSQAAPDYRPLFLHAASVAEYLLREAPPVAPGVDGDAQTRTRARLKALAAVRSYGDQRLKDVEAILGAPLHTVEAAWQRWVPSVR